MSKAFTREDDAADDVAPEPIAPPAEVRNLITPAGLARLRDELQQLRRIDRPKVVEVVAWAAGNGDRSENGDYIYGKRRLREIDSRIRFLIKRIESAEPVDPARQKNREQVFFGATVTYADADETRHRVRIVGIDETQEEGAISWISPLARALLRARVGDTLELQTPAGPRPITVHEIEYPDA